MRSRLFLPIKYYRSVSGGLRETKASECNAESESKAASATVVMALLNLPWFFHT